MSPIACRQCGHEVQQPRECYATPICYACLPPPRPIAIVPAPQSALVVAADALAEAVRWRLNHTKGEMADRLAAYDAARGAR